MKIGLQAQGDRKSRDLGWETADRLEKGIAGSEGPEVTWFGRENRRPPRTQSPKSKSGTGGRWDQTKEDAMLKKMIF